MHANDGRDCLRTLRREVDPIVRSRLNGWRRTAIVKATAVLAAYVVGYGILLTCSGGALVASYGAFGLLSAVVGFNVWHDANHGALARSSRVNKAYAFVANCCLGVSSAIWAKRHNVLHHTYPNVLTLDHDIESRGLLRVSSFQDFRWWHQWQHVYAPLLYALTTIEWVLLREFEQYLTRRLDRNGAGVVISPSDHIAFWAGKTFYLTLLFIIPTIILGYQQALVGLLICHLTQGLCIAHVFVVAHTVEGTQQFASPDVELKNISWFERQLLATSNFCAAGKSWHSLLGGLNLQIEHHIFPGLPHVAYPELSPIVRALAEREGLMYNDNATFANAIRSHYRLLWALGRAEALKLDARPEPTSKQYGNEATADPNGKRNTAIPHGSQGSPSPRWPEAEVCDH